MVTGAVSQTTSTANNNNNMGSGNAPSTTAVSLSAADNGVEVPPTAPAAPRRGSENRRVSPETILFLILDVPRNALGAFQAAIFGHRRIFDEFVSAIPMHLE
jgi:hypothetical protein